MLTHNALFAGEYTLGSSHRRAGATVLLLALTVGPAFAATTIDTLPARLSTPGERYLLSKTLTHSGSGAAITIAADNISIDGQGQSISYCNVESTCTGIELLNVRGISVSNLTLVQGTASSATATAIGGSTPGETRLTALTLGLRARPNANTYGLRLVASGGTNEISSSTFNITGSDAMESIDNSASTPWLVRANTWNITGLTLTNTYARLINVGSGSQYLDNTISVDAASRYVNVFVSWQAANVKISGNRISFGSRHGRIFHLDDGSTGFEIADNIVTVSSKNVGDEVVYVYRLRSDAGKRGSSNHNIHHNTVDATNASETRIVSIGSDTYPNQSNTFHANIFRSSAVPIDFYGDYVDTTNFHCNQISHTGADGFAIAVRGSRHRRVAFENNEILTARADGRKIQFYDQQAEPSTWTFAATSIEPQEIGGQIQGANFRFGTSVGLGSIDCWKSAGARQNVRVPSAPANVNVR